MATSLFNDEQQTVPPFLSMLACVEKGSVELKIVGVSAN